jgi:SAM-dependent methyltransferase
VDTKKCPNCGSVRSHVFHQVAAVPVNSCLLFADRARAQSVEAGDIDLAFCPECSFIFNAAWKPGRTVYSEHYEETQGFSPTFKAFHRELAEQLIGQYDVVDKEIVEIGCGKGEFLSLLCELGGNDGIGYDPSFIPARGDASANVTFKREFFSETTVQPAPDLVCCKMTLEHVFETRRFAQAVRRIASPERGTIVFFQVPDVRRILAEAAFWDVYYEHCAYFSPRSLAHLFRNAGFEILRVSTGFDDQYLTIEARPTTKEATPVPEGDGRDAEELAKSVAAYAAAATRGVADWAAKIRATARSGGRTVLWGSGSKAVAFLSSVGVNQEIEYLVDINPYRHGKFVPGTGKQIVGPEFLSEYQPDLVIVMNPIYRAEIARGLQRLGCKDVELCALGESTNIEPVSTATPAATRLSV